MRIPTGYIQRVKTVFHIIQALLIFIAACITIAVLTKKGETDGRTKYFFALCFLSIPALIYQTMVPIYTRAAKFVNAYAFAAVDILYTIFWFSAFVAVATWNSAGIRQGARDAKIDEGDGNCTTFAYGEESKCNLSKTTVGFGVVIFIFFLLTTSISSYSLLKFRKEGFIPGISSATTPHPTPAGIEAQTKDAWSADTHEDAEFDDGRPERSGRHEEDEYALLHNDEEAHPARPLSWGEDRRGGSYAYGDVRRVGVRVNEGEGDGGYDEYKKNYSFSGQR
ncbi:hypothetical protein M501DRAFT_928620 [Patellaria atrata CBS 101060]|uniref:MARVEL domain-containing protein n=1 Tax=Patellaria atrata CBS 101060 TaxID=1346257 RepID=A0A9P4SF95_9PEZI|nr:hypothetical protein M501DRAFT_928620 [Patellaria atrata CBS 101060]